MAEKTEGEKSTGIFTEDKPSLQAPQDLKEIDKVLEHVDLEISFYRRRAGQVFFFGLLSEGLLLVRAHTIQISEALDFLHPLAYTGFFAGVAICGIWLGKEYRARIHILKTSRNELLEKLGYASVFPAKRSVSEIKVLYVILIALSAIGMVLVWLNFLYPGKS